MDPPRMMHQNMKKIAIRHITHHINFYLFKRSAYESFFSVNIRINNPNNQKIKPVIANLSEKSNKRENIPIEPEPIRTKANF